MKRSVIAIVAALLIVSVAPALPASADGLTVALVRVTHTSLWSPPSPDPMGITYLRTIHRFLVVDSEVDEMGLFQGANAFVTTPEQQVRRTFDTTAYTKEPTGIATNSKNTTFYLSNDDLHAIFVVRVGTDGRLGTADDRVRRFPTDGFGATDPEGVAFAKGELFIANGRDSESGAAIYEVSPGKDGRFDGGGPDGDDVITRLDPADLGLQDPEDVAFDPKTHHLFIVSRADRQIAEATLDGTLVNTIDVGFTGIDAPSGIAIGPGSDDPSARHIYVTDRGLDNDLHPQENDGQIIEIAVGGPTDSDAPAAPAGLVVRPVSTGLALDWSDNTETDIAGYDVYRSYDGTRFRKLNPLLLSSSRFVDTGVRAGVLVSYRVKALDTSGNVSAAARASGTRGPIAFLGASVNKRSSATRLTIARPAESPRGTTLIASILARGVRRIQPPDGWELVEVRHVGRTLVQVVYLRRTERNEPDSSTWVLPKPATIAGAVAAYSGVAKIDPLEASSGKAYEASTQIAGPSVTASTPLSLLVGVFGAAVDARIKPPVGMLEHFEVRSSTGDQRLVLEVSDDVLDAAGPTGRRTATLSSAAANIAEVLILRPRHST